MPGVCPCVLITRRSQVQILPPLLRELAFIVLAVIPPGKPGGISYVLTPFRAPPVAIAAGRRHRGQMSYRSAARASAGQMPRQPSAPTSREQPGIRPATRYRGTVHAAQALVTPHPPHATGQQGLPQHGLRPRVVRPTRSRARLPSPASRRSIVAADIAHGFAACHAAGGHFYVRQRSLLRGHL
jgi:hypothetical protein